MRTQGPPRDRRGEGGDDPSSSEAGEDADAVEAARYIADLSAQMGTMARAAKLDFLAYLLGLVHAESEAVARRGDQV